MVREGPVEDRESSSIQPGIQTDNQSCKIVNWNEEDE